MHFSMSQMTQPLENNICVIAGEASGDAQASLLIHELSALFHIKHTPIKFWGIGGPLLRQAGMESVVHAEDLAVMGIWEIIQNYFSISSAYKKLLFEIQKRQPSAIIVVDYPGFNLRFAEDATRLGFKVIYYIPPKIWAHGLSRVEKLKKYTSLMVSILPFEVNFFKEHGLKTVFVGNPLFDEVNRYLNTHSSQPKDETISQLSTANFGAPYVIGMLPGSRKSEVERMLPLMIRAFIKLMDEFPNVVGKVPVAQTLSMEFIQKIFLKTCHNLNRDPKKLAQKIFFLEGSTYDVMYSAHYAWVCSGTATLETAFFKTPLSAVYKLNIVTAILAKLFLKIKYVSLVNLCMDKEVIPEFLQYDATVSNLVSHAKLLLTNRAQRQAMISDFEQLRSLFPKNSAYHAALAVIGNLK